MNTKSHKRITAAAAALAILTLSAGCSQDGPAETGKAQVTMTFATRAETLASETGGLDDNEQMRTLRVIVARQNGEIVHNATYDIQPEETSKTITFSELTVDADGEAFTFHALANEDGTGKDGGFAAATVAELQAFTMAGPALGSLNALASGVPQEAVRTVTVKPQADGETQRETIPLVFAVAKVRLTIVNTSATDQTVSGITLGGVNLTSTPLFTAEGHTPAGDTAGSASLGSLTAPAGGEASAQCYIYENAAGSYVLSATWNGGIRTLDLNDYGIASIPRGKMLDITVTLHNNVDAQIAVMVNAWEEREMNISYE